MKRQLTCLGAVLVLSAGCGIGSTGPVPAGAPATVVGPPLMRPCSMVSPQHAFQL